MRTLKEQIKDYKNSMFSKEFAESPENEKRYLWLAMKKAKLMEKHGTPLNCSKYSDTDSLWSD